MFPCNFNQISPQPFLLNSSNHNFELNHDFELACLSMLMVIINPGFLSSAKRNFNNSSIMYSIHIIPQLSKKIKSFIDRSRSPGPLKKFPSDDHQGIYVRKTAFFCSKKLAMLGGKLHLSKEVEEFRDAFGGTFQI